MSRNLDSGSTSEACNHAALCSTPSTHATVSGYHRPTSQQRRSATRASTAGKEKTASKYKKRKRSPRHLSEPNPSTFPAPLVLPGDEISWDPEYPYQSFEEWLDEEDRNEVTPERNVIYIVAPPEVDPDVAIVEEWTQPQHLEGINPVEDNAATKRVSSPRIQDIAAYLAAFYHGLPVRQLQLPNLRFTSWEESISRKGASKGKAKMVESTSLRYVGLNTTTECIRIRVRASKDNHFQRQLNLNDLLDTAISILPEDAYALLLLVDHDIFESSDDDFACGRAYGGSRVAVVSTARYHPMLDLAQDVEREHAWPASHCREYMDARCKANAATAVSRTKTAHRGKKVKLEGATPTGQATPSRSPLEAAVSAHATLGSPSSPSPSELSGLWLARVCRTASHEMGHCFGIDHCMYYACVMQGTASLIEDGRQPPYLCPVDLVKVVGATGADMARRYQALMEYCEQHADIHMFAAYGAWIAGRMLEMGHGI